MDCATLVGRVESAVAGIVVAEAGVAATAWATASATVAATLSVAVVGLAAGDVPAVVVPAVAVEAVVAVVAAVPVVVARATGSEAVAAATDEGWLVALTGSVTAGAAEATATGCGTKRTVVGLNCTTVWVAVGTTGTETRSKMLADVVS